MCHRLSRPQSTLRPGHGRQDQWRQLLLDSATAALILSRAESGDPVNITMLSYLGMSFGSFTWAKTQWPDKNVSQFFSGKLNSHN